VEDILTTIGLGSCIAVCVYDRQRKWGGMAHVVLPASNGVANPSPPAKFADLAVPLLLEELLARGSLKQGLKVALVGGAKMFYFGQNPLLDIGQRNYEAIQTALRQRGIRVVAEEVGGQVGRTACLALGTGRLTVRTIGQEARELVCL
jgi:chemotaxis protein CheD